MSCKKAFQIRPPKGKITANGQRVIRSQYRHLLILVIVTNMYGQTFNIQGNIITEDLTPVKYAAVTFIDQNDTTQRFSTVTDTLGDYRLSVTTAINHIDFTLPSTIELAQNYPNPFSGSTLIRYQITRPEKVSIRIYNLLGQEVRELKSPSHAAGVYGLIWDGRDNHGKRVAPGVYFCQLHTGNETKVKKMLFGLGGMNVSASILQSGLSQTIELKKANKAWSYGATAETFTVQIENLNCTTTPQIATKQFNNIAVQSDTMLNFVVAPAAAQPPSPVYPAPYGSPIWHPDGRIAFNWTKILKINRCTGGVSVGNIDWDSTGFWMINGDITGLQKLFPYGLTSPVWSSDGQWIAFGAVQIYKMKFTGTQFDTTTVVQLTTEGRNFFPAWSPDRLWIAYDSNIESPNGMNFIWKMKSDGTQKRRIAYEPGQGEIRMPNWSPDGRHIVHQRYVGVNAPEIVVMDTSGKNSVRLTYDNRFDSYPKYSPDGSKIAFTSQASGDIPQLWIINADGTDPHQITTSGAEQFSWSPDGSQIVYVQHDARKADVNNGTLWIMSADGNNKRQITFNRGLAFVP